MVLIKTIKTPKQTMHGDSAQHIPKPAIVTTDLDKPAIVTYNYLRLKLQKIKTAKPAIVV